MNKLLILLLFMFGIDLCQAQYAYFGNRGTISFDKITYDRARVKSMTSQMSSRRNAPGGMPLGGGFGFDTNNIPESSTQKMTLQFDESQTLMTFVKEENSEQENNRPRGEMGGRGGNNSNRGGVMMGMRASTRNPDKTLYQNIKKQTAEIQIDRDGT